MKTEQPGNPDGRSDPPGPSTSSLWAPAYPASAQTMSSRCPLRCSHRPTVSATPYPFSSARHCVGMGFSPAARL